MSAPIALRFQLERPNFKLAVDLQLPASGVSALFGPSGSGKTSCLRVMAGLERASATYLAIGDEVWQDDARGIFVPPHQRALGVVFQEARLFPHLSVRDNINFGARRAPAGERRFAFDDIVARLAIEPLLERRPGGLSGGESQRVAIARALLAAPRVLLMDEPLAALDHARKQEILPYLEGLRDALAIPLIYVSHAPDEVARLADHLVLLEAGRVAASGPLSDVLGRIDLPAAFADDAGVVITARIAAHEVDELSRLEFPGGLIYVSRRPEALGTQLRCRIHARDVSLSLTRQSGSSILNCVAARVDALAPTPTPGQMLVRLDVAGQPLLARLTRRSVEHLGIVPGLALHAHIKSVALLA